MSRRDRFGLDAETLLAGDVAGERRFVALGHDLQEADRLEAALAANDIPEISKDLEALEGQPRLGLVRVVHAYQGAGLACRPGAEVSALEQQDVLNSSGYQMKSGAGSVGSTADDDHVCPRHRSVPTTSAPRGGSVRLTWLGKIGGHVAQQQSVQMLQERLAYEQKLVQLVDRIHSAKGIDNIFIELQGEILELLDADRMTIYAVDTTKKELYSKFLALDDVKEIRLPVSEKSIAGYVAASARIVNIADAYDKAELARISPTLTFDGSWDKKTGFRTQQILGMPILHDGKPIGVIQLLNKKRGARFTKDDETGASRIAKTLGIAFNNQAQLSQSQELAQIQARPKTKFDYLLAQSRITQEELASAVAEARRRQSDVESILIEQYKVPRVDLGTSLSQFYECPFVEYDDKIIPPPDLMKGLRIEYLRRNFWLPLRREDHHIVVLIDNPQDLQRVDSVAQALKNRKIKWAVGLRKDILSFLGQVGGGDAGKDSIGTIIGDLRAEDFGDTLDLSGGEVDENDSAVIRLANQIIVDAYKSRASDIHIEPYGSQRDTVIRYRIDGGCAEYQKIPGAYRRAIVARIKIMAQLDIAERRKPQDGKIKFKRGRPRDRAARRHDPDREPERGRGHARAVLERARSRSTSST